MISRRVLKVRTRYLFKFILLLPGILAIVTVVLLNADKSFKLQVIPEFSNSAVEHKGSCHDAIDWRVQLLEDLTLKQIVKYLKRTNSTSCNLSHDFGGSVVFTVGLDGQKAVCLDPLVRPERASGAWPVVTTKFSECLVYSFGINNEWSFDEAMEAFGCRVYAFDPSMNATNHNHTSKIHFYNLGLSDRDETWHIDYKTNWTMKSLDSIYYNLLKHEGKIIDYLKIDIEYSEWIVLPQILASGMMDRVRQLGVEIHLIREDSTLDEIRQRIKVLKSLEDYGFVRFDSKPNPWSFEWKIIDDKNWLGYNAYEIFWYNSKLFRNIPSNLVY